MYRQRRSLGKNISQSNRVNKLSDIGALLYTWMIPHYDDEGRMSGDPEDIRYNVIPRRQITTEEVINCLLQMDSMQLITWYVDGGELYIQMDPEAWKQHQTFKGMKQISSKIPKYDPEKHQKYVDLIYTEKSIMVNESTQKGGVVHPEGWSGPPGKVDMSTPKGGVVHPALPTREVKLREDKSLFSSDEENKQPSAASSGKKHFSKITPDQYLQPILDACSEIKRKKNLKLNPYQWVQQQINNRGHPGAMLKSLRALLNNKSIKNPIGYLNAIMKIENGKFNAEDFIAEEKAFQNEWMEIQTSPVGKQMVSMMNDAIKAL